MPELPDAAVPPPQRDRDTDGGGQGGNVKRGPRPSFTGEDADPFPANDSNHVPRRDPNHR